MAGFGCQTGRHSTAGFHLPPDGQAERGRLAFVANKCHDCHTVSGVELPDPPPGSPKPIPLGGVVRAAIPDSHLFTSVVHPSYKLANYPIEEVTVQGRSLMPSYAESMTVSELTDIVEFLQAHYQVRETARPSPAYF
jgi:hypothetical protein